MSEKGAEDIGATVADTHSSRRPWSNQSPFPVHGWESSRLPTLQTVRTITGTIYGNFFFFFYSVQTLPFIRCSCCTHLSHDGPPYPISQRINTARLSRQVGFTARVWAGWEGFGAANPRWRSGYLWRCVLWRRAGLWGCGIARLRSSMFAVERRKCISGAFYSSQDNSCVPHDILLLVHFSALQYSDFYRRG